MVKESAVDEAHQRLQNGVLEKDVSNDMELDIAIE